MLGKILNFIQVILPNLKGFKEIIVSIITVAIVVIFSTIIEKYIDTKFQHFEGNIHEHIDTTIETSVKEVIDSTELFHAVKVNKAILQYPEIDIRIENILINCLTRLDAGKAQVGIFHNGTKTIGGDPFLKFTCTNEAIVEKKIHVLRSADQYQNSSYARIAYYAMEMNKNGYFVIDDSKDFKQVSLPDYQASENLYVKSVAFIQMLKPDGSPLGFIVFYSYDKPVEFSKYIDYLQMIADLVTYEIMQKYDAY